MSLQTIFLLTLIGLAAGVLSGLVGVGGGVVIVPALVFLLGLSQHQAQGTSLFILSLPVLILAVMNYWKTGNVNWRFGLVIASTFVLGAFIGSKLTVRMPEAWVKLLFGVFLAYVSIQLMLAGFKGMQQHD
ncbi:MAG: TSUP family transporter [Sphingomonadales bacterium]